MNRKWVVGAVSAGALSLGGVGAGGVSAHGLVLSERGSPLLPGAAVANVDFTVDGMCVQYAENGTLLANGKTTDRLMLPPPSWFECDDGAPEPMGSTVSGGVSEVLLSVTGVAILKMSPKLAITTTGPCVYEYTRLKGTFSVPGPVFITVTKGEVTFYEVDDPNCTPKVVREGQGYVDSGHGHIGRNETANPAQDVVVAIAPVGRPFRNELPAPGPYCGF